MLRVALKGLLGHKLRFALTALAVVIGVTFLAGSFILTDSIQSAFDGLFDDVYADTDVYVEAPAAVDDVTSFQTSGPTLPVELLDTVAAVEGVERASGFVEGVAQFVGQDGETIGTQGAPRLGESFDPMSPVDIATGRAPEAPGEVAVDRGTAATLGIGPGDTVEILVGGRVRDFEVVGLTSFGDSDNLLGATIASFDLATAQELFGKEGRFDAIAAAGPEGADEEVLRDRIAAAVGDEYEVVTAAEEAESGKEQVAEALGFLSTALLVFAGVAMFVGAFIIANTFTIVVAQRSREFALLRAVGASTRQVRTAVVLEALAVGLLASTVGIVAGLGFSSGLQALMNAFGLEIPSGGSQLQVRTVVVAYAVGVGITVLASLGPARRASRVAPVEAMRGTSGTAEKGLRRRVVGGIALTAVGVALLLVGLLADVESLALTLVGTGAALTLLGVALMAPLFAGPVAAGLGAVAGRVGFSGRLAQRNAGRDRRRTAATASALMIGLALVTFVTILTASIQGAVTDTLDEQFRADFVAQSSSFGVPVVPTGFVEDLREQPAIAAVSPVGFGPFVDEDGRTRGYSTVDPATITQVVALEWTDTDLEGLAEGGVLVSADILEEVGRSVGDRLPLTFANGTERELEIVGSFAEGSRLVGSGYVLATETVAEAGASTEPVLVYATAGEDLATAREAIDAVAADYPGTTVRDQAEFREQQESSIDTLLNLFLALLALALLIALLGIANTLALAVFERTREIGLLRAVGMDRGQTGRMIVWEAVIVSVFGALLGLVVGTFFGWAVVQALAADGIERVVVPTGQLAVYVVMAAVAGAVAALFPAWRAARLDVLEAVTTE